MAFPWAKKPVAPKPEGDKGLPLKVGGPRRRPLAAMFGKKG